MLRTDENHGIVDSMATVREVGEDFKNVVMEVHGMFDKFVGSLFRLPGRLISSHCSSPVWTIAHLRFRNGDAIIQHNGSSIHVSSNFPPLPGIIFPDIEWKDSPLVPPLLPPMWDYPEINPPPVLPDVVPPGPGPTEPQKVTGVIMVAQPDTILLDIDTYTPPSMIPDEREGAFQARFSLFLYDALTGGWPGLTDLDWKIEFTWSPAVTWLYVRSSMETVKNGEVVFANFSSGGLGVEEEKYWVKVNMDDVPVGEHTIVIQARAVSWTDGGPKKAVVGPWNVPCVDYITVTVKKLGVADMVITPPASNTYNVYVGEPAVLKTFNVANTVVGTLLQWHASLVNVDPELENNITVVPSLYSGLGLAGGDDIDVVVTVSPEAVAGTFAATLRFTADVGGGVTLTHDEVLSVVCAVPSSDHVLTTFSVDLKAWIVGVTHVFGPGSYHCDWNGSEFVWAQGGLPSFQVSVAPSGSTWVCTITISGGPYGGAYTVWSRSGSKFGGYSFVSHTFGHPLLDEDNVVSVVVSPL